MFRLEKAPHRRGAEGWAMAGGAGQMPGSTADLPIGGREGASAVGMRSPGDEELGLAGAKLPWEVRA